MAIDGAEPLRDGISGGVRLGPPQNALRGFQDYDVAMGDPQDAWDSTARVAVCSINQWALDFDGNYLRIVESIRIARQQGAKFRVGPELETCGYGCEDHFLEEDTKLHSWEMIAKLLASDCTDNMLVEVGAPVMFEGSQYNCRVLLLNKRVLLIRPKTQLVDEGGYRESRYFSAWQRGTNLHQLRLHEIIVKITGQQTAPIGVALLQCKGTVIGFECCEELWSPFPPHAPSYLQGAEIVSNGSSSYYQSDKYLRRLEMLRDATKRHGGVYLYANQLGCDGGKVVFDGGAAVCVNGEMVAVAPRLSLEEVVVETVTVDLSRVRAWRRSNPTIGKASASLPSSVHLTLVHADIALTPAVPLPALLKQPAEVTVTCLSPAEETSRAAALWLWDYLRRSGVRGYFVPLSGGADSAAVLLLLAYMCYRVMEAVTPALGPYPAEDRGAPMPRGATTRGPRGGVLGELERIIGINADDPEFPRDARTLSHLLIHTCYMGTQHSSSRTRDLSNRIADELGAYHVATTVDTITAAFLSVFKCITGWEPRFERHGGTIEEDVALQNIQARVRMVMSYLLAQLLPYCRRRSLGGRGPRGGPLLVVGTGNADEALRGYLTKYDCSSGDVNPIGSISKADIQGLLAWAATNPPFNSPVFAEILSQRPSAELRPMAPGEAIQDDEAEMGLTYGELSLFGRLRRVLRCGPLSMLRHTLMTAVAAPSKAICEKVQHFFVCYGRNRHKSAVLTPSLQLYAATPDDSRFDHRPLLYPPMGWQFAAMKSLAAKYETLQAST